MALSDSLYTFLLEESRQHRERVSTVWLQKFSMLGAIIVFAAVHSENAAPNRELIAAALLSLPIIAILLDAKLTEFAIHALAIDSFIIRTYPDPPQLAEWERTKWGWSTNVADRGLIRARTTATICSTILPTCLIAALALLAAKPFVPARCSACLSWLGIGFCVFYIGLGGYWWRVLTRRPPASVAAVGPISPPSAP